MKKITLIILVAVAILSVFILNGCATTATSKYDKEILEPDDQTVFNYKDITDLQEYWNLEAVGAASSTFSIVKNGTAPNYLKIDTTSSGYASVSRTVYLKPYSYYKIAYTYTTSTMSQKEVDGELKPHYLGLIVGFKENPAFNVSAEKSTEERTSNNSGSAYYYFKTSGIRECTLNIMVGSEDLPVNVSNVTLKNISLTRVTRGTATAENETGIPLYTLKSAVYNRPSVLNVSYVIAGAIVTMALAYIFYVLRARSASLAKMSNPHKIYSAYNKSKFAPVVTVLSFTLVVRLLITLLQSGLGGRSFIFENFLGFESEALGKLGLWLGHYGPTYFFEYNPDSLVMPLMQYIIMFAGLFGRAVNPAIDSGTAVLTVATIIKLFAILADVGTVLIIYNILKSKFDKAGASIFAIFYSLLPIVFFSSSYIGSAVSIATFFTVLSFYYILKRNYIGMSIAYFVACLISPAALMLSPFILMYTAYIIIQSIKEKNKQWIKPAVAIPSAFILYFLITLPFFIKFIEKGNVFASFGYYIESVRGLDVYTANAFNFQGLLGNNFGAITVQSLFVTILFIVFVVGLFGFGYFKTKNRLSLMMLSASFVLIYWYFCNNMTPNAILLMFPLMFIYTALVNDKRLYFIFSMLAAFSFINSSYVYLVAGYNSAGITKLGYDNPIMYIMGSFYLVLIIAYVFVAYDTIVSKKAKSFMVLSVPLDSYYKSLGQNTVINLKNIFYKIQGLFSELGGLIKGLFKKDKEVD